MYAVESVYAVYNQKCEICKDRSHCISDCRDQHREARGIGSNKVLLGNHFKIIEEIIILLIYLLFVP